MDQTPSRTKQLGVSLSRRLIPTCLLPHRGLVFGAIIGGAFAWTGRVCGSRNFTGRGRRLPTGSPWLGRRDIRHIGGEHLVCVHINGVVGTTRAVHGVCSFRSPRHDSSGWGGALIDAKGVASVKPGGCLFPTGSLAAAEVPEAEGEPLASHGSELRSEVTIFRHSFSILFSGRFRPVLREDL